MNSQLILQCFARCIACLSLLTLAACSKNSGEEVAARVACVDGQFQFGDMNGIIGGEVVDKNSWLAHRAVFLIDTGSNSGCTGLLVDRNIVLTAAHCVDSVKSGQESKMRAYFSAQPECDKEKGTINSSYITAEKIVVHPNWKASSPDATKGKGDLALFRLSRTAPADWSTTSLTKSFIDPRTRPTLVAGFGNTIGYNAENDLPIMLRATLLDSAGSRVIQSLRDAFSREGVSESELAEFARLIEPGENKEMLYFDQSQNHGVCSGDSGGASFSKRDGKIYATGVASSVLNPLNLKKPCRFLGVHTSVNFHQAWIDEAFLALRNYNSVKTSLFE